MVSQNWDTFFRGFQMDMELSIPKRIALLLDWSAKKSPGTIVPYNIVQKHIMGFSHTPQMRTEAVQELRRKFASVRPLLQDKYKRDLFHLSGVGVRATTGDLDVVKTSLPGNVRRMNSARAALSKNVALVDAKKLPTSGPDRQITEWFMKVVSPAVRALATDERFERLLPPAAAPRTEDGNAASGTQKQGG